MNVIGISIPRVDGVEKVTGRAKYTGDLVVLSMVHGKVLRSPVPHAKIKHIDTTHAARLPGVVAVLTREQLRDMNPYFGHAVRDRPVVAIEKVRYEGDPVAAVAAVDEATAKEALGLINVEYEELPAVLNIDAALSPGAPQVHESNICHQYHYEWGNVEQGFAESERIFEDVFTFPMVYHYALESHTAIARWDDEGLTVWSSAQHPFFVRAELAEMFRLPLNRVRVIVPYVGGGFGSKSYCKIEPLVAVLAREAACPVRLALSLDEAFKTVRRHAARCHIKTGIKKDGTLLARECRIYLDTGAYADNGPMVAERAGHRIAGPYRLPNFKVDSYAIYTNTSPAGSFRSIGAPQTAWASDSQMDIIAAALGIDAAELRLRNLARRGEELQKGSRLLEADLIGGLQKVAQAINWGERPADPGKRRGKGLGCAVSNISAGLHSTAFARLHADGCATVFVGTTEIGQGSRTVMAQIVAQELGLEMDRVRVLASDTGMVPFDHSTGASRSTTLMGLAVREAAREIHAQLRDMAARYFGAPPELVEFCEGAALWRSEKISYRDLIQGNFGVPGGEVLGRGYITPEWQGGKLGRGPLFWEVGIGAAEIEVDEETGEVRVTQYISLADAGRAINPKQCEGQDEGAAMQGLGHTLYEEMVYEGGQLLNANLVDYRVPGFLDLPEQFHTLLVENEDGPGPYGAKGLGEGGIVPVAPAVANALYSLTGVRIKDLPLTPERVWRKLKEKA